MLKYQQGTIPKIFNELKQAFNCSEDVAPPRIKMNKKKKAPYRWNVVKYSWGDDNFTHRKKFASNKEEDSIYYQNKHKIYFDKIDERYIIMGFAHALRAAEMVRANNYEDKDVIKVPVENIVHNQCKHMVAYFEHEKANGVVSLDYNMKIDFSKFFVVLARKIYNPDFVPFMIEKIELGDKKFEMTPHRDIYTGGIDWAKDCFKGLAIVAAHKIKDPGKFLENDPALIRKPAEQIIQEYPELFEDLFIYDSVKSGALVPEIPSL